MTVYFVSRHSGAWEWARRNGFEDATIVEHLDPAILQEGDQVLGTLPVAIAAEVCARRCAFYFLAIDTPLEDRGRNLSTDEMEAFGARLERYDVRRI